MNKRDEFLRSQKVLRLATVGADGTPHVVPVWYGLIAKKLYVGTNAGTQKARNVGRNGDVAFCVDVGVNSPDIFGVAGRGRASLILEVGRVKRIARRILSRYYDSLESKAAAELLDDTDCIIEIVPDRLSYWSY